MPGAPAVRSLPLLPTNGQDRLDSTFRDATSQELVFAVVSHAGGGATWVAHALAEELRKEHGYEADVVKMSELITKAAATIKPEDWAFLPGTTRGLERTQRLQDAGNMLRQSHGSTFTAALAIKEIVERRARGESPSGGRRAYILDSLKNPVEIEALRKVYGSAFYVISVIAGPEMREGRLRVKYKGATPEQIRELMARDEAEKESSGQQVRKALQAGDFFVNNERNEAGPAALEPASLANTLKRFLQIVFGTDVVRPTLDERGMHAAWSASLRSSCLSRQVGAAILGPDGQMIALGTNDVPKYGGGLYEPGDAEDHRCFRSPRPGEGEELGFCRNDKAKNDILAKAVAQLRSSNVLRDDISNDAVIAALRKTPIDDLIEFSRAVHAEMDAIVTIARTSGSSSRDSTLFCRTYPCHSCARHIVAAGIRDVVYIEPYTKSRAASLHDDAIVEATAAPGADAKRVVFRLFTGVAPRRYAALFEKRGEIKRDGRVHLRVEAPAEHTDPVFTKSYLQFEATVVEQVKEVFDG